MAQAEPSKYELDAWQKLEQHNGKPLSAAFRDVNDRVVKGAVALGQKTSAYVEEHPGAGNVANRGKAAVTKSAKAVGAVVGKVGDAIPAGVTEWTGAALDSAKTTAARASRAGLSAKRVVDLHKKKGHGVDELTDVRRLDLKQVDKVGRRGTQLYYPGLAALSGAGTALVISGGQIATVASGGAAAAPSTGMVLGAVAVDATAILTLATRAVGHVALLYGYDPEDPNEKIFALSVVNAGTAISATAKTAAFADVSRLTQALVRGKTWEVLNKSVVSKVTGQFAKAFGVRLTKKSLGKFVPIVGIVLGGTFNWATLEGIFDAAYVAYRRRFLAEKYPQLLAERPVKLHVVNAGPDEADEPISVLDELAEAGGPDLRNDA
ncbi:EcsC family protein [Microbacterium sp.]|uniref:EcsC family protein n=1 Tax=Microbacterium sp. TaxID=51671 RepID=UPI002732B198|nr:EcsC family protein [Microbacterium sp.]MDP3951890.1 EcsC family protein [Microbacterium sp.]